MATPKKLNPESAIFKGLTIWLYMEDGLYKYTTGNFRLKDEANKFKNQIRKKGFDSAFVVPFYKNKRVRK